MQVSDWVGIASIVTNFSIVLVGVRLIRHITRVEYQVELMWGVFVRRFGTREEHGIASD